MIDGERPRLDARHVVLGSLVPLIVAIFVVTVIGRVAGFARLTDTLRAGNTRWLMVCAVGQLMVFVGWAGAFRAAVEFERGHRVSAALSIRIALAGFACTQLIAAGGVAGLGFVYWVLRQLGLARRDAAVRLIGLNTAVYLVLGLGGLIAALVAFVMGDAPLGMTVPWIVGIPLVLTAARWFTQRQRVERWATLRGSLARRGLALGVAAAWWVRRVLGSREGHPVLAWSVCYWVGDIASLWGALNAFGTVSIVALPIAYTTGYLAQSVPIPFVATGGADAATTLALHTVGVPLDVALVSVMAHRVFAFWVPIVPGLVIAAKFVQSGKASTLQPPRATTDDQ
jgi:uncharacterized membrane protein YbhN (UPF0104 family)